jgi:polyisoprenoid-binding protein YceI
MARAVDHAAAERGARIHGNVTLCVSRPVIPNSSFVSGGTNPMSKACPLGFNAATQVKRSDFGISAYVPVAGDVDASIDRVAASFRTGKP